MSKVPLEQITYNCSVTDMKNDENNMKSLNEVVPLYTKKYNNNNKIFNKNLIKLYKNLFKKFPQICLEF